MTKLNNFDESRNIHFRMYDVVKTVKGAQFWGKIIAFDEDEQSPGCTVMAIAPGFEGIKHVYPLKQLAHAPEHYRADWGPNEFVTMGVGDGGGREFIHGAHTTIIRVRRHLDIANAAIRMVEDTWMENTPQGEAAVRLMNAVINRKVGL